MTPTVGGDESERRQHWDAVYAEKDTDEVSWFEASPTLSLAMLDAVGADPSMAVIDIGAGASRLAGALLERGFTDITALDVADDGLAAARSELGPDADKIIWLVADLVAWSPGRRYDIWHDRAVFHFLTTPAQQRRYLTTARAALHPGATMIIATFADDGPEQCSGLPVACYSPTQLVDTLNTHSGAAFELIDRRREEHRTPWGSIQPFTWCALMYSGQHATRQVKAVDTDCTENP